MKLSYRGRTQGMTRDSKGNEQFHDKGANDKKLT